ncbi:hypothetical protein ACFLVN_03360 [Chloroflexota bacterium]
MQLMGVIAEFERGRIGERVKGSRQYLISGGNWPGGRTAYGYHWLAEERKWELIPEEAEMKYERNIDKQHGELICPQ